MPLTFWTARPGQRQQAEWATCRVPAFAAAGNTQKGRTQRQKSGLAQQGQDFFGNGRDTFATPAIHLSCPPPQRKVNKTQETGTVETAPLGPFRASRCSPVHHVSRHSCANPTHGCLTQRPISNVSESSGVGLAARQSGTKPQMKALSSMLDGPTLTVVPTLDHWRYQTPQTTLKTALMVGSDLCNLSGSCEWESLAPHDQMCHASVKTCSQTALHTPWWPIYDLFFGT